MAKEFIVYSTSRASFEALVASGEVDNTQIGIIAESGEFWENGNYHPLVLLTDYLKKNDAVNFAKDLTGSLEPTSEIFSFRPSAGDKSIRDESAVIRRIKGNAVVFNQHVLNGAFADGMDNWRAYSNVSLALNDNGSLRITHTSASSQGVVCDLGYAIPSGHKIMAILDYRRNSSTSKNVMVSLLKTDGSQDRGYVYNVASGLRREDAIFITSTGSSIRALVYPFLAGASGAYTDIYSFQVFDLTEMFGAGYEPTTLAGFRMLFPDGYYDYSLPALMPSRAYAIETIGFNAFDKSSVIGATISRDGSTVQSDVYSVATIEVVPTETYYLKDVANQFYAQTYAVYDSNMNTISLGGMTEPLAKPFNVSLNVTIPGNGRYIRVCCHNDYLDACCVNLAHTNVRNGEYAEYKKSERQLPEIAKYFPNGMYGIGDVYDEINDTHAITRIGVRSYEDGDEYDPALRTDLTMTVYSLEEPITTPILEPVQLEYDVEDFGTERVLYERMSAPFRADIVYQFNAADRIRDNARNIERLEAMLNNGGGTSDAVYVTDFTMQDIMSGEQFPADCLALEEAVRADKLIYIPYNKEESYYGGCVASVWLDDMMYITIPTDYGKTIYIEVELGAQDIYGQTASFQALNTINGRYVDSANILVKEAQSKVAVIANSVVELEVGRLTAVTNGVQNITVELPTSVPEENNVQRCGITFSTSILSPTVTFDGTILWDGGTPPTITTESIYEIIFTWDWYKSAWLGRYTIYK